MCACICVWVCACEPRYPHSPEVSDPLELELHYRQLAVSHPLWGLETVYGPLKEQNLFSTTEPPVLSPDPNLGFSLISLLKDTHMASWHILTPGDTVSS